jgi:hypothetical protein
MNSWDTRLLVEDAVARATDDWIHVADFIAIAKRTGVETFEGLRVTALGLIAEVLCSGFMVAGDADEMGFHSWETSPGEAVYRVAKSWDPEEMSPTPGAIAWFSNTRRGDELGRLVHQREDV